MITEDLRSLFFHPRVSILTTMLMFCIFLRIVIQAFILVEMVVVGNEKVFCGGSLFLGVVFGVGDRCLSD
ncbi:hypothetical protein QVD17_21267 [Tagetes erecta]|uniref:Uncharacterized protein n=1 Tax=Tagetes erecta TaxID=13708 RepID=A0AAD8KUA8_TARER|nr:hypothetical protein QVD17_21267 [Tagetes erecta]